jgi:hypothetical protein
MPVAAREYQAIYCTVIGAARLFVKLSNGARSVIVDSLKPSAGDRRPKPTAPPVRRTTSTPVHTCQSRSRWHGPPTSQSDVGRAYGAAAKAACRRSVPAEGASLCRCCAMDVLSLGYDVRYNGDKVASCRDVRLLQLQQSPSSPGI